MSATTGLEQLFATGKWRVEPTHSVVGFRVEHLMIETVVGRFREFAGVIDTGETRSITGSIRAASLETRFWSPLRAIRSSNSSLTFPTSNSCPIR